MLGKNFKCPCCKRISSAGEWNVETSALCESREAKRHFARIQEAGKQKRWYQCPKCHKRSDNIDILPVKEAI